MEGPEGPEGEANQRRCTFYLQRKRRVCKMFAARGSAFCVQHMPGDEVSELVLKHLKSEYECRLIVAISTQLFPRYRCSPSLQTVVYRRGGVSLVPLTLNSRPL